MLDVTVHPLVDEGLGNSAYLVELGDGRALAVDASRDLRQLRRVAASRDLAVAFAADTHLHADFVTGALELADSYGARVLAAAAGQRQYPHAGLGDGDEVDLGGLTLRVLATPGHTHEHIAFELRDGDRTVGVFTGGSLLVGSAARTDLVAPERTEELTRAQFRSLRRLSGLADTVAVWPTHGPGSFCTAASDAQRTSTIGAEKAGNPLLRAPSEEAFVQLLLGSLGTYPAYFSRLPELNRRGPTVLGAEAVLPGLSPGAVASRLASGAEVVDVRPVEDFAAGHVPGALANPLREAFATWLGALVAPDRDLVVVRNADQDSDEIVWQSRKIGYDRLVGELAGGMAAWRDAGRPVATIPVVGVDALTGVAVLDVRQASEFVAGHVPGAHHVELGALTGSADDVPAGPTVVMCGHGERAVTGASLLARSGRTDLAVLAGGPDRWEQATGTPQQRGA
jgi:glyoxylase-like metal-dependent hydrolase (beta-lactamase superfamily II)/rhodanese-related sulfurtransferase